MPFSRPTLLELRDRIGADIDRHGDGDPNQRGSLESALKHALTGATHSIYGMLDYLAEQLFDDSADDINLLRRAAEYKIYRIAAKTAQGSITATGDEGVVIIAGTEWTVGDERYITDSEQTITDGGATLLVTALNAGTYGNQLAGTTLQIVSPISGLDSDATVDASAFTGGADIEKIERVRERLQDRKQTPPRGGTSEDWVTWCKQGHQDITRVWPKPNQDNLGAVKHGVVTCYMTTDELASPIPSQIILDAVYAYTDRSDIRPIGMKMFYILAPTPKALDISFTSLTPNTVAVQTAVIAELVDLLKREAVPGGTILLSHIREAISLAIGENDYVIGLNADFTTNSDELTVIGVMTWPGA